MPAPSRLGARGYTELGGAAGIETLLSVTVVSTISYGIYYVLFVVAVYLHSLALREKHASTAHVLRSPVFIGTIMLFFTITTHWVMTIIAVYNAFRISPDSPAFAFYQDPLPPAALVRNLFLLVSWSIGDLLIIHRLWTVWSHNRAVIIFPICTWLGLTASGIGNNVASSLRYVSPTENFPLVPGWFTSQLVFTLCTTVYCTSFLAYCIWSAQRRMDVAGGGPGALMTTLAYFAESAMIYTLWIVLAFVAYQTRSSAIYWAFECSASVVGTVNMLIYVRVGLGWAQGSCSRNRRSASSGIEFGSVSGQVSAGFGFGSTVSPEHQPGIESMVSTRQGQGQPSTRLETLRARREDFETELKVVELKDENGGGDTGAC